MAHAIAAITAGESVILPTDTVYGLVCAAESADAVSRMYELKGRGGDQPTSIVAADVDAVVACIAELRGRAEAAMRAVLPAAVTLVLPNPAQRLRWLAGDRPQTIGVRVPELTGEARAVVERSGIVAATSANLPGGPDPRRLADVPAVLRAGAGAAIDGGLLPGTPSTVIDLTGPEPVVLREGALPGAGLVQLLRP